jgi:hypothetical protein
VEKEAWRVARHTTPDASKERPEIVFFVHLSDSCVLRVENPCLLTAQPGSGTTAVSSRRRNKIIAPGWLRDRECGKAFGSRD